MARILVTSWGSHGDVDPYLALAHALRARGHEPVLAMMPYYAELAAAEGFAFHPVGPDVRPENREFAVRAMDARRGTEYLVRDTLAANVERTYEELDAAARGVDLVVSHPVTFAAPLVAGVRGLPWVSTVLAPISFFSAHDLPVFPPAPWLKDVEQRWPAIGPPLVRLARRMSRGWAEPIVRLRARLGLPPAGHPVFEGQHSPHAVLALFSRVLAEPMPDWPARVTITGALVHDAAHGGRTLAPALDAFLDAGEPPVVFTLGTSAVLVGERFYVESAAAVRRLGRRAVLLVGRDLVGPLARLAGPDVLVVPAAPHSRLFPRAAAVVQQCGIGTLGQALRAGRPLLCVPWSHDQPDNAWRATRLGVGRTLHATRYTARRAADALRDLLGTPSYAQAASRVASTVRAEDGPRVAADAIEAVLDRA